MLTVDKLIAALPKDRYEIRTGELIAACPVSMVPSSLREAGWRNVSQIDAYELKQLGMKIVEAQYVGGVRKTGKFIDVVVLG